MKPSPKPTIMFAWWDEQRKVYSHLYDRKFLVELAKGSGVEVRRETKAGEGALVKVTVTPVQTNRKSKHASNKPKSV